MEQNTTRSQIGYSELLKHDDSTYEMLDGTDQKKRQNLTKILYQVQNQEIISRQMKTFQHYCLEPDI